ncbi:hypothetical protein BDZ45DRAFT_637914, partial [Acephala macrosclerotiorum]
MESAFRVPTSLPDGNREYARRYTSDEWEAMKPKIQELYVQDEKTLQQVIHILERGYGFTASEKQLKSRISKWRFDVKNVKGDTMVQMARARLRRKRVDGKGSVFRVNKKPVADRNINRYLKRNNVSEEDLLSMTSPIDAPSPAFSVFSPRPDPPSDASVHAALSVSNATSSTEEFVTLDLNADSGALEANTTSNHLAYSRHNQLPASSQQSPRALAISRPQSLDVSRYAYFTTLPGSIQDLPDSPEVLLWRFREQICPMLSATNSQNNNMWQTLVLPLVHNSQSLCLAISAITALHISTGRSDVQLHARGMNLMLQSLRVLRSELGGKTRKIATLATVLILAFWTSWNEGLHLGRKHVKGALVVLWELWSQSVKITSGSPPIDPISLAFLATTGFYMDARSSVVHATMAKDDYKMIRKIIPEMPTPVETYLGKFEGNLSSIPLDPWMFCAGRVFRFMKRAADLCYEVRMANSASSTNIAEAVALAREIVAWTPNALVSFPSSSRLHVSGLDERYMMYTAEGYRYATLLYLRQAVPEMPSISIQQLARDTIRHLSSCPPSSTIALAQVYPLFVAGCEASSNEERQWVKERWTAMIARMRVTNVHKCWEITQEVWKRRDAHRQQRSGNSANHLQPMFQCLGDTENIDPEFT